MAKRDNITISNAKRRNKTIIKNKQKLLKSRERCYFCKGEVTNAKFILRELTILGYTDYEFCSAKCLLNYIFKRFKGLLKKMQR